MHTIKGDVELIECDDEPSEARDVVSKIKSLLSTGHPDIEGSISLERCAVLGRNRFVFGSLEQELKKEGIPFYKKLSSAAYQSESDVVEQFELALRLLANPRDRLHLTILIKAWGIKNNEPNEALFGNPVSLIQTLAGQAQKGCAAIVTSAIAALQWSREDFKLLHGLKKIDEYALQLSEQDRALVLQDTAEWKKHWDA